MERADWQTGDIVRHRNWGEGKVLQFTQGMVEVAFDERTVLIPPDTTAMMLIRSTTRNAPRLKPKGEPCHGILPSGEPCDYFLLSERLLCSIYSISSESRHAGLCNRCIALSTPSPEPYLDPRPNMYDWIEYVKEHIRPTHRLSGWERTVRIREPDAELKYTNHAPLSEVLERVFAGSPAQGRARRILDHCARLVVLGRPFSSAASSN